MNRNRNRIEVPRDQMLIEVTLAGTCAKVAPAKHAYVPLVLYKQEILSDIEIIV